MLLSRTALAGFALFAAAAPAEYLVPNALERTVMLLDDHDGAVLDARYIEFPTGGALIVHEAAQVGDEIWAPNQAGTRLHRFSLDGDTELSPLEGSFALPIDHPAGFYVGDDAVYIPCQQFLEHGISARWVARLFTTGTSDGLFDLPNDAYAADLAPLSASQVLASNTTNQSLDIITTAGALVRRIPVPADPNQASALSPTELAVATTDGLYIYSPTGDLVGSHLIGTSLEGVAPLASGELLVTGSLGVAALDRSTDTLRPILDITLARYVGTINAPSIPCPADFNTDGAVDSADIAVVLAAWGQSGPTDLSADGATGSDDLAILLAAWGECP